MLIGSKDDRSPDVSMGLRTLETILRLRKPIPMTVEKEQNITLLVLAVSVQRKGEPVNRLDTHERYYSAYI